VIPPQDLDLPDVVFFLPIIEVDLLKKLLFVVLELSHGSVLLIE